MGKIPWDEIDGRNAALLLSEGDYSLAAEILKSDREISRELRDMIAAMLDGFGPNNTKLQVIGKNGRIAKANAQRDLAVYYAVREKVEETGCSVRTACEDLNGFQNLAEDAIRKIYQRINKDLKKHDLEVRQMTREDGH